MHYFTTDCFLINSVYLVNYSLLTQMMFSLRTSITVCGDSMLEYYILFRCTTFLLMFIR
jgi:hypothetical protein